LLVVTVIHSVSLISQYIEFPNRVTGLLKDYSQASMIILITFGLVYSRIRDSKYATPLCFVLFLGFFTTFSRTANVLLIVFLCALSLKEYNQGTFRRFAELTLIIGFAALIVYTFPMLAELEVVDRGGLAHIKTLNSRTTYWFAAWQAIQQVPFSGHGLNTFELTGIKVFLPQEEISMIHNDYLQILHDLGIVWFTLFVAALGYLIVKTAPCRNIWNPVALLRAAADTSLDKFVCWILLILIAAYMTINFLILSSLFQLSIVLILVKLMSTESDKLDA
jgi:O-antigen ligase